MRHAIVIAIGTELALGQSVDTNTAWIARRLAGVGIRCRRHVTVADELADILETVRRAAAETDLVVITGGLGPTDDDLTRAALAQAAGCELVSDPASLEQMRAFFARRGREMPERNRVQALRPSTGRALENTNGTAPGVYVTIGGTPCYALPGVPAEMAAMFEREVEPQLQAAGAGRCLRSRLLHTIGLPESEIGGAIADLMQRGRNPEIGTTAELGIVGVRVNAEADSQAAADRMLDEAEAELRRRLGGAIFGRDGQTLAEAVGTLLAERRRTVCTAESCTGGLLSAMFTDVPGSSRYFVGGCVAYANRVKRTMLGVPTAELERHGAVSEPVARWMAEAARERFRTDYALSVTGIAGPGGGSPAKAVGLVYVGLAGPEDAQVRELRVGEDAGRAAIRIRSAHSALAWLRRRLLS